MKPTLLRRLLLVAFALAPAAAVRAEDTALLIQLDAEGRYTVWHAGAPAPLAENELLALEAAAVPEGSRRILTSAGLAQSFDTPQGILIRLPALGPQRALLIDRDGCGGIKVWHSHGDTHLSEDALTELVLTALPEGGPRLRLGPLNARAYSTKIGVIAVLWRPLPRPERQRR